jgi:hypothetical protein
MMRRGLHGALALAVVTLIAVAPALAPATAHAQTTGQDLLSFAAAAQAPVMQVTEDGSTAAFHPQGEGELTYAESDLDSSHAHALSTVLWPGGAAGNLGSLLAILGYPGLNALNDPVRAEVSTSGAPQQNLAAGPASMSASIQAPAGTAQQATADTTVATAGGVGGSGKAHAALSLGDDGTLNATASTSATNLSIGGIIDFGSLSSSATSTSSHAATPASATTISAGRFTIGGQPACLDNTGVHLGKCDNPASSQAVKLANQVLNSAGMQIYFTEPHQLTIANVAYNYAASLLVVWVPPGDPSHDIFTISFGGAAVAMQVSGGEGGATGATDTGSQPASSAGGVTDNIPANPSAPTLALPTTGATGPSLATTRLPTTRRRGASNPQLALRPVSVSSSHGISGSWIVLLVLAAVLGAVALPRLPALLSAAAQPVCPDEPHHDHGNR